MELQSLYSIIKIQMTGIKQASVVLPCFLVTKIILVVKIGKEEEPRKRNKEEE